MGFFLQSYGLGSRPVSIKGVLFICMRTLSLFKHGYDSTTIIYYTLYFNSSILLVNILSPPFTTIKISNKDISYVHKTMKLQNITAKIGLIL